MAPVLEQKGKNEMANKGALALVIVLAFLILASHAEAKGGGGGKISYVWDASTPEEKALELFKAKWMTYESGLNILAIHVPREVKKIEELSPRLEKVLCDHVKVLLQEIKKTGDPFAIGNYQDALSFYHKKLGLGVPPEEVGKFVHASRLRIAKTALADLKSRDLGRREHDIAKHNLNAALRGGISFEELGVTKEEVRDLAK